jgi:short-subunit dehydrogenase involved in D-alanine esterification of teichoic acids
MPCTPIVPNPRLHPNGHHRECPGCRRWYVSHLLPHYLSCLIGIKLTSDTASGIGRGCALALVRHGARGIIIADLNLEAARSVAEECRSSVPTTKIGDPVEIVVEAVQVDVTKEASVEALFQTTTGKLGRIDYCVNSAGVRSFITVSISPDKHTDRR